MLRRLLDLFKPAARQRVRYIPSVPDLPGLWFDRGGATREPHAEVLDDATTDQLTRLCDDYWNHYLTPSEPGETVISESSIHHQACKLLATRRECLPWARERLKHPGYDAREDAASLIRQLAEANLLGSQAQAVAEELVALAVRPPVEDTKEAQAASVALSALSVIGGPACMKALRGVLLSPDWDEDDNQLDATEILARITGQPFMDGKDPVADAKAWLVANPESK